MEEKKNIYNTPEMLQQMGTSTMRPVSQVVKEINEKIGEPADGQAPTLFEAIAEAGKDSPEERAARKQLAGSITAKGVATPDDATMQQMSYNVDHIAQTHIELDADGMYSKQLFGGNPDDSPLWNLYDVLAQMKNKYLNMYSALIVCEYYKGYDSLQLQGADAYYTCDGDEYDYDALHTWHDSENGRANRWVCFLFRSESTNFDITNTNISPRSMYIGGHIGLIKYFVAGRLTEFVSGTTDSDIVDVLDFGDNENAFGRNLILKGTKKVWLRSVATRCTNVICDMTEEFSDGSQLGGALISGNSVVEYVLLPNITELLELNGNQRFRNNHALRELHMPNLTRWGTRHGDFLESTVLELVEVGELTQLYSTCLGSWNPTTVLSTPEGVVKINDNIRKYIAAKVSDRTGQDALTFTVSTNLYNNLEPETIAAFTAKNWNVAGA